METINKNNIHVIDIPSQPKRVWLDDGRLKYTHLRKREWLDSVIEVYEPGSNRMETLEALIFLVDPVSGAGAPSVGEIMSRRKNKIAYSTCCEHLKWFVDKGVLGKEKGRRLCIPRYKTPPNIYTMIGYEHKLDDYYRGVGNSHNINNKIINTYMYVAVDKSKKKTANKVPSKHINEKKLAEPSSKEAQNEIVRACEARKLTTNQIVLVLYLFQTAGKPRSPGGYLNAMMDGVKKGTWTSRQSEKKTEQQRFRDQAQRRWEQTQKLIMSCN